MTSDESHETDQQPVDGEPVEGEPLDAEPVDRDPLAASAPALVAPRSDAAMQRAAELAGTTPTEHVEIYEDVHRRLQEVLADASGQSPAPTELAGESAETGDAAR
jgi:hypothetical protein